MDSLGFDRQNDSCFFSFIAVGNTEISTNVRQSWRDRQTGGVCGGCFHFITRVFILECLINKWHNVRQKRQNWVWSQSQWSLSKSFVALMHEASVNIMWQLKKEAPQMQNKKAETKMREHVCSVQAKLKGKYCWHPKNSGSSERSGDAVELLL